MIELIFGVLFFNVVGIIIYYFSDRDVTVDTLFKWTVLGCIPGGLQSLWIFIIAVIVLNYALMTTVIISNKVVFNWSNKK